MKKRMAGLRRFYAVTRTSLYVVRLNQSDKPELEKLALKGTSVFPLGSVLHGNDYVGITRNGLMLFDSMNVADVRAVRPHPGQAIHGVGEKTSAVVALFQRERAARACFESSMADGLDGTYQGVTERTLEAIGENHPVFIIARHPDLALCFPAKRR